MRAVGFAAHRRLLDVQTLSHDCQIGADAFRQVTQPQVVGGQRVSALPFADPRTQALLSVLVLYCLLPQGFANKDVRARLALLLGLDPSAMTPGKMTYDLRRLRLHGLIERLPRTHRYRVTAEGLRTALFFTRVYLRILRPGLARITPAAPPGAPQESSLVRRGSQLARPLCVCWELCCGAPYPRLIRVFIMVDCYNMMW